MPGSDTRRTFLERSLLLGAALWPLEGAARSRVKVSVGKTPALAEKEMLRGLLALRLSAEVRFENAGEARAAGDRLIALRIDKTGLAHEESYEIRTAGADVILRGASECGLLCAVFEFLERQGAVFGIDGENYPPEPARELVVPGSGQSWTSTPRFAVRGLLPWPDFLNCITMYNEEDFRAYFEAMLRMRMNTFGMHVYTQKEQWAESYLNFEFAGAGHLSYLDNTASNRWGYLPERTSRFGMGSSQYFDGEVFGSDATRNGRNTWEIAENTQKLLKNALSYAKKLGIRTGVGFEPYQIPDEIYRALPPEARFEDHKARPRFDPSSYTGRKLLEARLDNLLNSYPDVDHVWLWEDEGANWDSRKEGVPLPATAFQMTYDYLRRHAPKKRLIVAGWGGVARHFAGLHKVLPEDIVFSCLSDSLGWDPVHEVFGQLGSRERWPIPWLEDDPSMWMAQFHVNRFKRDVDLADKYGCQGMLGIHWRHRIVDPTATFFARAMWDKGYTPDAHYAAYAKSQASGERAGKYGRILSGIDRNQSLLRTGSDVVKDGHVVQMEFTGDYDEGFKYWTISTKVSDAVRAAQQQAASELRALTDSAPAVEKDRMEHVTRHIEFMAHYAEAWIDAQALNEVLKRAVELRKNKRKAEAKALVEQEGLPLWLKLAPEVRQVILRFHGAVATRNDIGTLASMQNKFVRIALDRLPLSMAEFLERVPAAVETAVKEARKPDTETPARLIVPVRPTMLGKGDKVRILAVVPGADAVHSVTLRMRPAGSAAWAERPFKLLGRKTWEVWLELPAAPGPLVEYSVTANAGGKSLQAPVQGAYRLTVC